MLDPADCGPAFLVALPGHPGDRLRLSRGLLRADRLVDPAPAPRPRPAGRGGGAAQDREEAADHLRRRRALLAGRGDRGEVRARPRHPDHRDHRRQGRGRPTTTRRTPARSASSAPPRPTRWRPRPTWCWRSAPGCMDFTTGSWTVFNHDARIIGINAARWDATKHRALAVVGDARETVAELDAALGDWKAPAGWTANARDADGRVGQARRRLPEADERAGADLCPGDRRGARRREADRPDHHRRRRPAGRAGARAGG